jgi:hypothetical protein
MEKEEDEGEESEREMWETVTLMGVGGRVCLIRLHYKLVASANRPDLRSRVRPPMPAVAVAV